eukprot:CAMPEP_0177395856 /NCGR_PEP_ID=MMETSP0368-20130122/56387_1 /TAXON_ID=447022 ORGANISM="Scrippsiella hangoei-like, Strain SHHI-4" /NCGR_SAMPLE_ID=MMETSP0368 /ASSEMBLY_ACC=CAM_ASM_000363 /LENGTH=138 /DNA_ID=CAMNT_0018862493 /DNA_START=182 /DNA_END=594 /DNA_ORIENTATION=+
MATFRACAAVLCRWTHSDCVILTASSSYEVVRSPARVPPLPRHPTLQHAPRPGPAMRLSFLKASCASCQPAHCQTGLPAAHYPDRQHPPRPRHNPPQIFRASFASCTPGHPAPPHRRPDTRMASFVPRAPRLRATGLP